MHNYWVCHAPTPTVLHLFVSVYIHVLAWLSTLDLWPWLSEEAKVLLHCLVLFGQRLWKQILYFSVQCCNFGYPNGNEVHVCPSISGWEKIVRVQVFFLFQLRREMWKYLQYRTIIGCIMCHSVCITMLIAFLSQHFSFSIILAIHLKGQAFCKMRFAHIWLELFKTIYIKLAQVVCLQALGTSPRPSRCCLKLRPLLNRQFFLITTTPNTQ